MKAAVCYEHGKPLVVEEVDIDPPQKGEVKVKVAASAICHSDIHVMRGEWGEMPGEPLPGVLGHETAGYVEEVGEGITSVKPGDAVMMSLLVSCGHCLYCTIGFPHLCLSGFGRESKKNIHNKQGQSITQMAKVAGYAEHTVVDECQIVKVPDGVPLDRAALLGCGFITGFGAVVNRVQVKALSSVVVVGTGGVGLSAVQGAALSGAYPLIAVDILDNKLEAARVFGATHTVNAKKEDAVAVVQKLTAGIGADYVFVTGGGAAAVTQGYAMSGPRGTTVLVALPPMKEGFSFPPPAEFIAMEKSFVGSFMGSTRLHVDIPRLMNLYLAGRLKLDELITGRYPLEQINEAIESVERGEALRNVIIF